MLGAGAGVWAGGPRQGLALLPLGLTLLIQSEILGKSLLMADFLGLRLGKVSRLRRSRNRIIVHFSRYWSGLRRARLHGCSLSGHFGEGCVQFRHNLLSLCG